MHDVAIAWLRVAADLRSSSFQSRNANRALIPPLPRLVLSVRGKSVATGRVANTIARNTSSMTSRFFLLLFSTTPTFFFIDKLRRDGS